MKIAAVVVTYNRLNLLKECINAIRNQTRKVDEIFVINNGSTDGSLEWLMQQNDLTVITQENSGSAGGQYTGIKTAYEKGYDWIWCMDDDGYPTTSCLMELVKSDKFSKENVLCSLSIDPRSNRMSFSIPVISSYNKYFDFYTKQTNEIQIIRELAHNGAYQWGTFFNSILISDQIIKGIGLPRKDFFIWGDEVEYFYRIKESFNVYIIINSIFYHPSSLISKKFLNNIKYQSYVRNYAYINKRYKKLGYTRNLILFVRIIKSLKFNLIKFFIKGLMIK